MPTLLGITTIITAYLIGSIPTGLLIVRILTGKDIREVGSGRTGGTNALRAAGAWGAILTMLSDALKGFLAIMAARLVAGTHVLEALAGLAAVIGHNYSIFIKFKGGAGTMCTVGGAIGLWPWSGAILIATGLLFILITRYASLGSISIALILPLLYAARSLTANAPWEYMVHGVITTVLTLWALQPNIKRLIEGQERLVTLSKKTSPARN